ncbi:GntR family transcriptional regulator [Caulobacter segnis]|uniref:Transcriptional regulator, GntR family n=2 Tax=Caulobacter segnis TaxID=88688 RepID=D5VKK0_CAUST|nr:GntR family transcriptional regulator [Caulobacter segnis]ADG11023.1 transcriptional regulator, GntR family [Caulobacter segnis ATCC 21756]AVQ02712.1 GntR family transcriptional regulator [Caulobacter segnis]
MTAHGWEPALVRDRDPFDRTLETLRQRLTRAGPLQGAALPISGLAEELGVSPTPVREVLARLAGEGLIARTPQGYAALLLDPAGLAELYDLASVLVAAAVQSGAQAGDGFDLADPLSSAQAAPNRALAQACARVQAQLAPLARAEAEVFGAGSGGVAGDDWADRKALLRAVRRHYARRAAQSGRILAVALGLLKSPRI